MANLDQILTRVSANVVGTPTYAQHNIEAYVQVALNQLQALHNFQIMKAEAPYLSPGASPQTHVLGAVPSNWKEPRGMPYYTLNVGSTRMLVWQPSREYMYRAWNPIDTNQVGPPRNLLLGETLNPSIGTGTTYAAWVSGTTYASGAYVTYPGTDPQNPVYTSLQGSNTGHNPSTSPTWWSLAATEADTSFPDATLTTMNIEVYPYPDGSSDWSDGLYRIQIPYWAYVPILSTASSSNWFTVNAVEFLVAAATAMVFEQGSGEAGAPDMAVWTGKAGYYNKKAWGPKWDGAEIQTLGGWAKIAINLDKGVVGEPSKTLIPRRDVFGPRDQWRQ